MEESSDDEEEERKITYHENCHVIENSLNKFFFNDEIDSDSDSLQLTPGGKTGSRDPINPDCLPAANECFNCFQRTSPLANLISIESPIKQLIATCIHSKKDPKCSQEFYALVHRQLFIAQCHKLISSPEELDAYWLKFDNWATCAYQEKVVRNPENFQAHLQTIIEANDPSLKPPNPTQMQKGPTSQHYYRIKLTKKLY